MNLFDTHCHLDFNPTCLDSLYRASLTDKGPKHDPREERRASPKDNAESSTYMYWEEERRAASGNAIEDKGATEANARHSEQTRMRFACMTCSPSAFTHAQARFADNPAIQVACGLHPRWIANRSCGPDEVGQLCALIAHVPIIGEIGLDFLPAYEASREDQLAAFDRIIRCCSQAGGKVLSIHALRSADCVLDTLERYRATENCQCVLHWFSGSSDQLHRAIKTGCWFSVNRRMLSTKKGREYARIIPEKRLLLESDLPSQPNESAGPEDIAESLGETLELLAQVRGRNCGETCFLNANTLFGQEM